MFKFLLRLSHVRRNLILLFTDFAIYSLAVWLSLSLRLGGWVAVVDYWLLILLVASSSVAISALLGIYSLILRYFDERGILRIAISVLISSMSIALIVFLVPNVAIATPRSVIVIFGLISFTLIAGIRFAYRLLVNTPKNYLDMFRVSRPHYHRKNIVIFGAGDAGVAVMESLRKGFEYNTLAFIDDNKVLQSRRISDIPVLSRKAFQTFVKRYSVNEILIAIPKSSLPVKTKVIEWLTTFGIKLQSVPAYEEIASGRINVETIQDVDVGDLLGREKVQANIDLLEQNIKGQSVLVTGAGGSIGSELSRIILRQKPKQLVLYDSSEYSLYQIDYELRFMQSKNEYLNDVVIIPCIGSVNQEKRLRDVFQEHQFDTVFHAAAYKHVPLVELNVTTAIENNVYGTIKVAELSAIYKVKKFILISTDKAVRPTNIMGSTKRLAELALQSLQTLHKDELQSEVLNDDSKFHQDFTFNFFPETIVNHETQFAMVRFGNVLASSGSVIPVFKKQIEQGGPITVTHPEITRYFMTIPEAAELVIQAGAMAKGGEVYLLDMGEPVKIVDLAKNLIRLSGLTIRDENNRSGDLELKFTGLRPGEKLYEELLIENEVSQATSHEKIYLSREPSISWSEYQSLIALLHAVLAERDFNQLLTVLDKYVSGFKHSGECLDQTWELSSGVTSTHQVKSL